MSVSTSMKNDHKVRKASAPPVGNGEGDGHEAPPEDYARGPQTGPVRARPSPSIHEDVISRHYIKDPLNGDQVADPVISRLVDAMKTTRLAAEQAGRVADAIHASVGMTAPVRHREAKTKTWKVLEPVLRDLDSAMHNCRREIERLEAGTVNPPRPQDLPTNFMYGEVRSRLATMSPVDRQKAVAAALRDDDQVVIAAILHGAAMLSNLTLAEYNMVHATWRKRKWGDEVERMERLKKALSDAEQGGTLALNYLGKLSSDVMARAADESEERIRKALAS